LRRHLAGICSAVDTGDYNWFEYEGDEFECNRKFQFLRSEIEVIGGVVKIYGALKVNVKCGTDASACLFEMPYTEVVLQQGPEIGLFADTRLRMFDPLESTEYREFAVGAFWDTAWTDYWTKHAPSAEERSWQEESAALCGAAADRADEGSYLAKVRALGASALVVKGERVPL